MSEREEERKFGVLGKIRWKFRKIVRDALSRLERKKITFDYVVTKIDNGISSVGNLSGTVEVLSTGTVETFSRSEITDSLVIVELDAYRLEIDRYGNVYVDLENEDEEIYVTFEGTSRSKVTLSYDA